MADELIALTKKQAAALEKKWRRRKELGLCLMSAGDSWVFIPASRLEDFLAFSEQHRPGLIDEEMRSRMRELVAKAGPDKVPVFAPFPDGSLWSGLVFLGDPRVMAPAQGEA